MRPTLDTLPIRTSFASAATILILSCVCVLGVPQGAVLQITPVGVGQYLLGDPVTVQLSVKNTSANPMSFLLPHLQRFAPRTLAFAVRAPGTETFQSVSFPGVYVGADKMLSPPKIVPILTIPPNSETNIAFQLDYEFPNVRRRRFLFSTPGKYAIKAEVFVLRQPVIGATMVAIETPTESLESAPFEVEISEPPDAVDRNALEAMRQLQFDYLLYAPEKFDEAAHVGAIGQITIFSQANAASRYAAFSRFFLAYINWKMAKSKPEVDQAAAALLGIAQEVNAPLALRSMADRLVVLKPAVSPQQTTIRETRPQVMVAAMKELESQWYDVKGFTRRSPDGQKAYIDQLLPLHEQLAEGKISQDAYDTRHAELLKECVKKFSSPLTPEEWKSRYDEYAAEEAKAAAQRATQEEAIRRRLIERLERPTQPKQ